MSVPLLQELKRRRVFRALVGYGIAAFAVLQIIEPVMHGFRWPDAVLSYVVVALAAGFPVVVGLAWIFDLGVGGIERTPPAAAPQLRGTRIALVLAGIGAIAAAPVLAWYLLRGGAEPARTATAASIAVLPFADMSPQKDQEYFSDGLSEEILNALAQVDGLHVAGRTSSASFKGKAEDLRSIGQKLGVATVLEGSVRKAENRVRITAQLIDVKDGFHLWSQSFDRELRDIFAVQDEIAVAVVAALRMKLVPGKAPTAPERRTADPEAYNQYLLGRRFFDRGSPESERKAIAGFRRAIELDPAYAPAWAGLSRAIFTAEIATAISSDAAESGRKAMEAAEKAVQLAPGLAEAWASRGFLRFFLLTLDWSGAEADLNRALAIHPGDSDVVRQTAMVRAALGRMAEAKADAQRATEIDPLASVAWWTLGNIELRRGNLDEAERALTRSLEISPEQSRAARDLGFVYLLRKHPEQALDACEKSTYDLWRLTCRALAWHDLGRDQDAARAGRVLLETYGPAAAYQLAQAHAWSGDPDGAFSWLGRALAEKDAGLNYVKSDPLLAKLHGDPRWTSLLKRMNLPLE
ncbi:MAG: tetratricopeptide repeat protein [Myxococcales bacterium]